MLISYPTTTMRCVAIGRHGMRWCRSSGGWPSAHLPTCCRGRRRSTHSASSTKTGSRRCGQRVRNAEGRVLFDVDAGHSDRVVEDAVDLVDIEYLDVLIDLTSGEYMGQVVID